MTVTDNDSRTGQDTVTITVIAPDVAAPVCVSTDVVIDGSINDSTIGAITVAGQTVNVAGGLFTATISLPAGASPQSATISASDGANTFGRVVTVSY